ncbi:MAG: CYTH domain-containing protein [Streptococcus hyointestinalis]|uniref:CYTH domain-containing protein n=1 Tax=Streptococcus hyointestinalis TaxID=1337 RepID=UPI0023F9183B|nr:CYTH domain-containing protein [Streptococcus hyointestinalis]MDD6385230.1 CYTH domain-containing protein [Streptococcus hyointestinalis]
MNHLEIEFKTMLTKDEFNRLKAQFSHVAPVTQTNYYFDTENFDMKAHRMSLRIRTISNAAELTLKIPKDVGNWEYNIALPIDEAKEMIKTGKLPENDITKRIKDQGVDPSALAVFGYLTTTRRECQTAIGLMALDDNQYAGIRDYELELEVLDAKKGKDDFDHFLAEQSINFKYAKSKVARFSATLRHQKTDKNS